MNQRESQALQKLLTTFAVDALGEGDVHAGTNLLAGMAITLANLAPTDNSVCYQDGTPARLGASLLVSGALSSGTIIEEVITETARRQLNLAKHLRKYSEWIVAQASQPGASIPPTGPAESPSDQILAEILSGIDSPFWTRKQAWSQLLDVLPTERFQDLATHPKFLVSAARVRDLGSQLKGLRIGRPLIHLGINQCSDLAELADPGAALIEGRYPQGNGCETIRGNFLLTDPLRLLNEAAKDPDHRTSWLGHFLWLVDGDAGPNAPMDVTAKSHQPGVLNLGRFRLALSGVISSRVNLSANKQQLLCCDTRAAAHRWTVFLREMEPRMPGISGAARNLPNSLVFGLGEMVKIDKVLSFTMEQVEALCRFLVRRAASARITIIHEAELARRRAQAERIYRKIVNGCNDRRMICKNTSINTADFDECVAWLEEAGVVKRSAAKSSDWLKVEGTQLNLKDCRLPLFEISLLKA